MVGQALAEGLELKPRALVRGVVENRRNHPARVGLFALGGLRLGSELPLDFDEGGVIVGADGAVVALELAQHFVLRGLVLLLDLVSFRVEPCGSRPQRRREGPLAAAIVGEVGFQLLFGPSPLADGGQESAKLILDRVRATTGLASVNNLQRITR